MGLSGRSRSRSAKLRRDALLAVVLLVGETVLWVLGPPEVWPESWAAALSWLALAYVAMALRRVAPMVAVGVLIVQLVVSALSAPLLPAGGVPLLVVTYTVASTIAMRTAVPLSLALWVPPLVIMLATGRTDQPPFPLPPAYFVLYNTMALLVCFFIGRTVYNRRAYVAALEDRARTAERNQRSLAEQAVADERRRIARELHDVVAHHVSVMGVLATGTRRALMHDPVAADEALATIEETGRVALREMRRLLTVLRSDAEPAGELEPQPGLPGLDALLEQVREAGLPVRLHTSGEPDRLDPGIALAVYRITQEALTNALKHAGPASAEVRLNFLPKELTIDIGDTGRGPYPGGNFMGHGLLGMRERISLFGGTLRTGPRPGGGFRVSARIPLEPSTASPGPRVEAADRRAEPRGETAAVPAGPPGSDGLTGPTGPDGPAGVRGGADIATAVENATVKSLPIAEEGAPA
jgi:signal transduction histidine kinase